MYIDSHCHLALSQFDEDREAILSLLTQDEELAALIEVSVDEESTKKMLNLFEGYDKFYFGLGMHPHSAEKFDDTLFDYYKDLFKSNDRIIAVGEVGLDSKSPVVFEKQYDVYSRFVEFASKENKPLIVHSRGYDKDILRPIEEYGIDNLIFHCFSSDKDMARRALNAGAYLSFSGIVTFPSAKDLREALEYVPLDRILVETDCPYLSPQKYRGQRNQPDRVKDIIAFIAELKGLSYEKLAEQIVDNVSKAFLISI